MNTTDYIKLQDFGIKTNLFNNRLNRGGLLSYYTLLIQSNEWSYRWAPIAEGPTMWQKSTHLRVVRMDRVSELLKLLKEWSKCPRSKRTSNYYMSIYNVLKSEYNRRDK